MSTPNEKREKLLNNIIEQLKRKFGSEPKTVILIARHARELLQKERISTADLDQLERVVQAHLESSAFTTAAESKGKSKRLASPATKLEKISREQSPTSITSPSSFSNLPPSLRKAVSQRLSEMKKPTKSKNEDIFAAQSPVARQKGSFRTRPHSAHRLSELPPPSSPLSMTLPTFTQLQPPSSPHHHQPSSSSANFLSVEHSLPERVQTSHHPRLMSPSHSLSSSSPLNVSASSHLSANAEQLNKEYYSQESLLERWGVTKKPNVKQPIENCWSMMMRWDQENHLKQEQERVVKDIQKREEFKETLRKQIEERNEAKAKEARERDELHQSVMADLEKFKQEEEQRKQRRQQATNVFIEEINKLSQEVASRRQHEKDIAYREMQETRWRMDQEDQVALEKEERRLMENKKRAEEFQRNLALQRSKIKERKQHDDAEQKKLDEQYVEQIEMQEKRRKEALEQLLAKMKSRQKFSEDTVGKRMRELQEAEERRLQAELRRREQKALEDEMARVARREKLRMDTKVTLDRQVVEKKHREKEEKDSFMEQARIFQAQAEAARRDEEEHKRRRMKMREDTRQELQRQMELKNKNENDPARFVTPAELKINWKIIEKMAQDGYILPHPVSP